jgi:hypothetical protein
LHADHARDDFLHVPVTIECIAWQRADKADHSGVIDDDAERVIGGAEAVRSFL